MAEEYVEKYVESIIIRQDNKDIGEGPPAFTDGECDCNFEFEGVIQLKQINKSIQNATHNRHDYVFKIVSISKMQKE
jgi:hypothetical protein